MSQYFYLVATLPYVSYESESFLRSAEFLGRCRDLVAPADFSAIRAARLEPPSTRDKRRSAQGVTEVQGGVYERYCRFERGLRNTLVRLRASKLGLDPADFVATDLTGKDYSDQTGPAETARQAFQAESPLASEEIIDKARWMRLEELSLAHYFDLDILVVYGLKLQILERRARRTREAGTMAFEKAYESVMESIPQLKDFGVVR